MIILILNIQKKKRYSYQNNDVLEFSSFSVTVHEKNEQISLLTSMQVPENVFFFS